MRKLAPLVLAVVAGLLSAPAAHACACCAEPGQRTLTSEPFTGFMADDVRLLVFDATARPYLGAGDQEAPAGIAVLSETYRTQATWTPDGLTLELGGTSPDRSGTLVLAMPKAITVFSADPTPGSQEGMVQLYKEWRIGTTASGTGAFAAVRAGTATLVFHGTGNSCDMAGGMTNWTLDVTGPGVDFRLFGRLSGN